MSRGSSWLITCALLLVGACGPSAGPKGQCKSSITVGDLVITEVFADFKAPAGGTGADEGKEWFEIYNASDNAIDLEGLRVDHSRPDGSKLKSHVMETVTLDPGGYLVLGNATPDLVPAYVDYGFSADLGDFFNTDGGKLALNCGDTEIDNALYDTVKEGHSRELTAATFPDYTLNDDLANWCQGNDSEFEAGNFGTPGSDNDCTPVIAGLCNDNGTMRDVVSPMPGQLVITEVMPNPAAISDTTAEWFEITATADVDLNGIAPDRAGDSSAPKVIDSPDCIHLATGDLAVFAKSTMMAETGIAAPIVGTFTFSLIDGTAAAPGDVQLVFGATVIDAITWTSTRSGKAHNLDPGKFDAIANDDESAFCDATTQYNMVAANTDFGTPGDANIACPQTTPAGKCLDVANGNVLRDIVPPPIGKLVITELMPHPLLNTSTSEWFEITNIDAASFDLNGLGLDRAGDTRKPDVIGGTDCKPLAPNAFAVFSRSAVAALNGGLAQVDATFGMSMVDGNGNVQVVDPTTCATATPFDCTTIFDRADWGTDNTTSIPRKGISGQLKTSQFLTTANDLAPTNYCAGTAAYGTDGNMGTPGTADAACP